jgi:hypothetical protein
MPLLDLTKALTVKQVAAALNALDDRVAANVVRLDAIERSLGIRVSAIEETFVPHVGPRIASLEERTDEVAEKIAARERAERDAIARLTSPPPLPARIQTDADPGAN